MKGIVKLSRRRFMALGAGAAGALVLGCRIPTKATPGAEVPPVFEPNAYLGLATDGSVTVWVPEAEMGQGVLTALGMLVADEMEAPWDNVRVEQAPVDPKRYNDMSTGGSTSVRQGWDPLRRAGATARQMLVTAAAARWGVDPAQCRAQQGKVVHDATSRSAGYGELATEAAGLPLPSDVQLKDPSDFRLIGKPIHRVDTPAKTDGRAVFAIDVRRPDMLDAVVVRCPVFGGKVKAYRDAEALKVDGVRQVLQIPSGVAVVADSTWAAIRGREALEIDWDEGDGAAWDDQSIEKYFEKNARKSGAVARSDGDVARALRSGRRRVKAVYSVPFLAHAPMEPLNAVADVRKDSCEIWVGTQSQTDAQAAAAQLLGFDLEQVTVHETFLGGGFGRRAWIDFVIEAVHVSRAVGAPVKLTWTREDDMRHCLYRPASRHVLEAAIGGGGEVLAWHHRVVAPSLREQLWPGSVQNGLDKWAVDGAENLPYAIPNVLVEYVMANTPVPVLWWRSVYNSQNAFANEGFLDEIAAAAGKDPVELRLELLKDQPRLRQVVARAAEAIGWGKRLPVGHGLGIACHHCFGSYIAEAAEVSVEKQRLVVHRVACSVDCGPVVNPDTIAAQMESAVVYGLSAALRNRIRIEGGAVVEGNWDDYEPLRLKEAPDVSTDIVTSTDSIGGIGEPGLPPIAPAVVNALYAATGQRVRKLPVSETELKG